MKNVFKNFVILASCLLLFRALASRNISLGLYGCDDLNDDYFLPQPSEHQLHEQNCFYCPSMNQSITVAEYEITELLESRASDPSNLETEDRLIHYSRFYPQTMVYHILAAGETSLMFWSVFKSMSYLSDEVVQMALQTLFNYKFSFKRILQVFKMSKELVLLEDAPFPKQIFSVFIKVSFQLFSLVLSNPDRSNSNQSECKLVYMLFEKILNYAIEARALRGQESKDFNVALIRTFPAIFIQLDTEIQFKIYLSLIYWDDPSTLAEAVGKSPISVFHVHHHNGQNLMHYAIKMSSVNCLRFLLDLLNEAALNETEKFVSPFVYAIKLEKKTVLKIFGEHGCDGSTVVSVDSINYLARDFASQEGFMKSYSFFMKHERL